MEWHESGEKPNASRESEAESVYKSLPTEEKPKRSRRKLSKLGVVVVIVLILVVAAVGCSVLDGGGSSSSANKTLSWPTSGMATRLPTPDSTRGEVTSNSGDYFGARAYDCDQAKYGSYLQSCKDVGYTIDARDENSYYEAYDQDGYKLELDYWDDDDPYMTIALYGPVPSDPISWPTTGLGAQLPKPASLTGEISSDSSSWFDASITNTTPDDYKAYVTACMEAGFTSDYRRDDSSFDATNGNGLKVDVDYVGNNTMDITASQDPDAAGTANADGADNSNDASQNAAAASGTSNQDATQAASANGASSDANATADSPTDNAAASNASADGNAPSSSATVTPSFKATMDSYETLIDKYVAFLKKYDDEGHPASMLADYTDMMQQYADTMEKLGAIDEDTLSDADLAYYIEVNARIQQKLLTVSS